jgi:hypothetical protein
VGLESKKKTSKPTNTERIEKKIRNERKGGYIETMK